MNAQRGFTYPFTLMLLILFSLAMLYFSEHYLSEKRINTMVEKLLIEDYYMLHAVKQAERTFQSEPATVSGHMTYKNGAVTYTAEEYDDQTMVVVFDGQLFMGEKWKGKGYYDKEMKKMIKWVESR